MDKIFGSLGAGLCSLFYDLDAYSVASTCMRQSTLFGYFGIFILIVIILGLTRFSLR